MKTYIDYVKDDIAWHETSIQWDKGQLERINSLIRKYRKLEYTEDVNYWTNERKWFYKNLAWHRRHIKRLNAELAIYE